MILLVVRFRTLYVQFLTSLKGGWQTRQHAGVTRFALPIFLMALLGSCHSLTISKKEAEFVKNTSSFLEGAPVTLSKEAGVSTSEGKYLHYDITIERLPTDTSSIEKFLLLAGSIPAFAFYKDTVAGISQCPEIYQPGFSCAVQ